MGNQEPLHPIQIERFRSMSFAEKWKIAQGMHRMAREARNNFWREKYPEWNEEQVKQEVAREFARTRT